MTHGHSLKKNKSLIFSKIITPRIDTLSNTNSSRIWVKENNQISRLIHSSKFLFITNQSQFTDILGVLTNPLIWNELLMIQLPDNTQLHVGGNGLFVYRFQSQSSFVARKSIIWICFSKSIL